MDIKRLRRLLSEGTTPIPGIPEDRVPESLRYINSLAEVHWKVTLVVCDWSWIDLSTDETPPPLAQFERPSLYQATLFAETVSYSSSSDVAVGRGIGSASLSCYHLEYGVFETIDALMVLVGDGRRKQMLPDVFLSIVADQ